jgi:predicted amidophosphoribosyltransferase
VGQEAEEEDSALTPETCFVCDEPLGPGAKACPSCGEVFSPDARGVEDQIQHDQKQDYRDAETDEEKEMLDALDAALNDPEKRRKLIEELTD